MKAFDSKQNLVFAMLLATMFRLPQVLAADVDANSIPRHFLGGFEAKMPAIIGDSIPNTIMSVLCEEKSGCFLGSGEHGQRFPGIRTFQRKDVANNALNYAKSHKNVAPNSAMAWYAKNLMPLLSSSAIIESCVDLADRSAQNYPPTGLILLCKLNKNPWPKPVVLMMGVRMGQTSSCGELYCDYEIHPLFKTDLKDLHGIDLIRLKVKLGDTLKNVKNAYHNVGEPTLPDSRGESSLKINEGVSLYFKPNGKISSILLGSEFIGDVRGVGIGDSTEIVSKTLGAPIKSDKNYTFDWSVYGPFDNFYTTVFFKLGQVRQILIDSDSHSKD